MNGFDERSKHQRQQKYQRAQAERGLTQVKLWVPASQARLIKTLAHMIRCGSIQTLAQCAQRHQDRPGL